MEDNAFDRLTRQVGQQPTRRTMVKTALGSALALVGLGRLAQQGETRRKRNNNRPQGGFEDDPCATDDDCRKGLRCQGARTGIAPGFPIQVPIAIPVVTGAEGTCQYRQGCGGERGDACRRNDNCCDDLICDNNRCQRR